MGSALSISSVPCYFWPRIIPIVLPVLIWALLWLVWGYLGLCRKTCRCPGPHMAQTRDPPAGCHISFPEETEVTGTTAGVHLHLTRVTICASTFRNWKSPGFTSFRVATRSALPGGSTSLLHLSQLRTAISVLISVCVLEKSVGHDVLPFWRALLLLQSSSPLVHC